VLDPDVVLRADRVAVEISASRRELGAPPLAPEVRGAPAVAATFNGRAGGERPALSDGAVGAAWAPGGQPRAIFRIWVARGKIVELDLIAEPERLGQLDVELLDE